MKSEEQLQIDICDYLRLQYPKVVFTSESSGFMKLPMILVVRLKKLRSHKFKLPDLWIAAKNNDYGGLYLEIKI